MASNPAPDKGGKERELSNNLLTPFFLKAFEQSAALKRSSLQTRLSVLPKWLCVKTALSLDQDSSQTHLLQLTEKEVKNDNHNP